MIVVRATLALALTMMMIALVPGAAQAQGSPSVSGTITYRERVTLPANALVTVQIADVTQAGRPAQVIAEQRLSTNGAQIPFRFTIPYDPARIVATNTYILQGNITVNGQVRFSTSQPFRVITQNNPVSNLNITMTSTGQLPITSGGAAPLALAVVLLAAVAGVRLARLWLTR